MEKLQVLLATVHQTDLTVAEKMNLHCSTVIANQADREEVCSRGPVKMITTATRGVGLNRNLALLAADGDILLFADDDVVYNDGMEEAVTAAFRENPKADVLVFGMDMVKDGVVKEKRHLKYQRLHFWNAMRFGTYRIAIRREAVLRCNLSFHQLFGGGCPFSAGEDSLFLKSCFDHGLRVYAHPYVLGQCCKDVSSWFVGYNEKYFYDKGVLVRTLFPRLYGVMGLYFAVRFKRKTQIGVFARLRLVYAGIRGGKTMQTYERYHEKTADR
jgi:glycosyltransferase involved in cell wall biosynthesis